MDSMTISDLNKIGITDDTVCLLIISQWKAECCGNDSPNAALKAVKHTIKTWNAFSERNRSLEAVDMRTVINDQKTHIDQLERREIDFQIELQKRADLVLNLRSQMTILESEYDTHLAEVEKARDYMASAHDFIRAEVAELSDKLQGMCTHINRIEREAKRTIRIVEDDLALAIDGTGSNTFLTKDKCNLVISVRRVTAQNLSAASSEDIDPFVVLQLGDRKVETKVYLDGGSASHQGPVVWDNLALELPTCANELETGSLKVQVWDFRTRGKPELVVGGLVSFPHDLSTARRGTEFEWPVLFSDKEGRPAGSVGLLLCVREKTLEGMGETGDSQSGGEVVVRDMLSQSVSQQALDDYVSSCENRVIGNTGMQRPAVGGVAEVFLHTWKDVLRDLAQISLGCKVTVKSSAELDHTQEILTRLLEEAFLRYRSHSSSLHTYMTTIEDLTGKLQAEKRALQVSSEWELKYDTLRRQYDTIRFEMQDLRSYHNQLQSDLANTSTKLTIETARAQSAESNNVELQNEVERLIEIIRRDMATRITRKSANEELTTLSSQLVARDALVMTWNGGSPVSPKLPTKEVYMHQHDWNILVGRISTYMTEVDVAETKLSLMHVKNSIDILTSRLYLETKSRSAMERKLEESKDDLQTLKTDVAQEISKRLELEEALRKAQEVAVAESENAATSKAAATDAIRQAQFFQKRLNREIDHLRRSNRAFLDTGHEDVSPVGDHQHQERDRPISPAASPYAKKGPAVRNVVDDYYDNLVLTPEGTPVKGGGKRGGRVQSVRPVLTTRSESGIDKKSRLAEAMRRKKTGGGNIGAQGSRFSMPGKRFWSKSKADKGAVTPMDYGDRAEWVDPNTKDYRYRASFPSPAGRISPGNSRCSRRGCSAI